ncbi:uncharacterized protein B0H18DRAFT_220586 [Fomitopsis serialis]|uniref:uncharacterized protein n=1 Tax=Fomitopsis serialis TaxID=139415 RepID=UPI002007FBB4|nr:uncharacterized protein B0H18DRAFT_220586 [Neoantrodia serialis]KAH9929172.1 hypothetical protein B0H18DRAFT_220586 [Neoantrodia serialis]
MSIPRPSPDSPLGETAPEARHAAGNDAGSPFVHDGLRMGASPVARAGLLQPRSFVSSSSKSSRPRNAGLHTQDAIRDSTMHISSIPLRTTSATPHSEDAFIFPDVDTTPGAVSAGIPPQTGSVVSLVPSNQSTDSFTDLTASTTTIDSTPSGAATPRGRQGPSGLSLLLARQTHEESPSGSSTPTPTLEHPHGRLRTVPTDPASDVPLDHPPTRSALSPVLSFADAAQADRSNTLSETTPLLVDLEAAHPGNGRTYVPKAEGKERANRLLSLLCRPPASHLTLHAAKDTAVTAVQSLPAVLLGTLLNILDGVSCAYVFHDHVGSL